jgi:hypothetical protein
VLFGRLDSSGRLPATCRHEGFREILSAALNTHYYRALMGASGLGRPDALGRLNSLQEALSRLPKVEPGLVRLDSPSLENSSAASPGPAEVFWPLPAARRTALMSSLCRESACVRRFREDQFPEVLRWRPEALAAPPECLLRLAHTFATRPETAFPLSHSLLVLCSLRRAFLGEALRDTFWKTWQVPVFGQLLGPSGELLAWECEAHDGFHFDPDGAVFETAPPEDGERELLVTSLVSLRRPLLRMATRLTGAIVAQPCACGSRLPRLAGLRMPTFRSAGARGAAAACAAD